MYNQVDHYNALMAICAKEDSSFYFVDQVLNDVTYRIFSYRIAGYTEFMQPYALDARGHMFRISDNDKPVLVSFPMSKFFNAEENPSTMGLDYSDCELVMDKLDGSLISSFLHLCHGNGVVDLKLKSKTSVHSDQAKASLKLLNREDFADLYNFVWFMEQNGYTVNMEYTSPTNRIVIPHQIDNLTVLNVRSRTDGSYMPYAALKALMEQYKCADKLVKNYANEIDDFPAFIKTIEDMTGCEGFVIKIRNGETVKIKNRWYMSLHKAKDSVNSPRALYECVVNEAHDDLRAAFHDDAFTLNAIAEMETKVKDIYIKINKHVEAFYNDNKHLDRKSYAILGQAEVPKIYFGLVMSKYLGKEVDYKEFLIKHWKDFGIKEEMATAE